MVFKNSNMYKDLVLIARIVGHVRDSIGDGQKGRVREYLNFCLSRISVKKFLRC